MPLAAHATREAVALGPMRWRTGFPGRNEPFMPSAGCRCTMSNCSATQTSLACMAGAIGQPAAPCPGDDCHNSPDHAATFALQLSLRHVQLIHTDISLSGIASADIIMTGAYQEGKFTPYRFQLQNVVMSWIRSSQQRGACGPHKNPRIALSTQSHASRGSRSVSAPAQQFI